jgi:hypothetical protein
MTTFPGSPRLQKGVIVGFNPFNPLAGVIMFYVQPRHVLLRLNRCLPPRDNSDKGLWRP